MNKIKGKITREYIFESNIVNIVGVLFSSPLPFISIWIYSLPYHKSSPAPFEVWVSILLIQSSIFFILPLVMVPLFNLVFSEKFKIIQFPKIILQVMIIFMFMTTFIALIMDTIYQ